MVGREGNTRHPLGRTGGTTSATGSVSNQSTGISPGLPPPMSPGTPEHSTMSSTTQHQHDQKATHAVTPGTEKIDLHTEEEAPPGTRGRSTAGTWEGPTSTVRDGKLVTDRTHLRDHTRPVGPQARPGPERPVKLPPSRCRRPTVGATAPVGATLPRLRAEGSTAEDSSRPT